MTIYGNRSEVESKRIHTSKHLYTHLHSVTTYATASTLHAHSHKLSWLPCQIPSLLQSCCSQLTHLFIKDLFNVLEILLDASGRENVLKSHFEQVSKIKRGTEISFPGLVFLFFSPTIFLPLSFASAFLFLLWWSFHCGRVPGLEVSHFGSFHVSISQAFLVSFQHRWHWLFGPLSHRPQPCPRFPAAANHHLVAVAGGGEAVVGCGGSTPQTEQMKSGGEMWRQAAVVLATTHTAPLRLGGTGGEQRRRQWEEMY